jgi:predicted amidohydrolase
MHNMFRPYPGLPIRLGELASLVDRMAEEAALRYDGACLDIAVLPEMAVNGGQKGTAADVAYPLEGPVLDVMGAKAREHRCHIVVPLYLVDNREHGVYSNAAALVDRTGQVAGVYRAVSSGPMTRPRQSERWYVRWTWRRRRRRLSAAD